MARLLITGGNGMVGRYAREVFSGHDLLSTDIASLDIESADAIEKTFRTFRPEIVLHLAAATDVDRCETEPALAFRVNAIGTENVALACRRCDALMIYASSGAVFPGDQARPYHEYDAPRPSNIYAASKLAGEKIVRALVERHYIVRAGWIFGGGAKDKKFVGKLFTLIMSGRPDLRVVDDKIGTPTYAKDFLAGIRRLLTTHRFGLYHLGNEGSATRHRVALEIAQLAGLSKLKIRPVSSTEFPLPAPRGASEALDNLKLRLLGLPPQRPWQAALAEYIAEELIPAPHSASPA